MDHLPPVCFFGKTVFAMYIEGGIVCHFILIAK